MSAPLTQADYRASHVGRGADYDAAIAADLFTAYVHRHEARVLLRIVRRLFPSGVNRYLDFACGTGRITQLIEPLAHASYGLDVSDTMVAQAARKCPRTTFYVADITRDAAPMDWADLVTAFRFFGNAQDDLRRDALRAIADVLKPGGWLIVNNHRNPYSINNLLLRAAGEPPDVDLSPHHLRDLLVQTGFTPCETHGIGLWLVLNRLRREPLLNGRAGRWLEHLSSVPFGGLVSPDAVVVARK